MVKQKATNVVWHQHKVERKDREELLKQKGVVLWFTGLPSSGKSTVANEVAHALHKLGKFSYVLDGDNIRHGLNKDLGFSPEDREENIRRISEVANLFADAGTIIISAFISPYREDRAQARDLNDPGRFFEVYCKCSIEACEQRDPKGLYRRARKGEVKGFTGVTAPYEEPEAPELVVETDKHSLDECVSEILAFLEKEGVIPAPTPKP